MREIMFRGIGINEGTFFYSMTVSNGTIKRKMNCVFLEVNGKWIGIKPETLGQFTGLCDKNGKEIYEGDIIQSPNGPRHTVKYIECSFVAIFAPSPFSDGFCGLSQKWITDFKKEIIGTTHENPELLK